MERSLITKLADELSTLQSERIMQGWDKYWRDCMRFALPQDISYDRLLEGGSTASITGALTQTVASRTSKTLYDQTSLWGIERLTAGLISLKTPEGSHWHGLDVDDPFGYETTHEEEVWFDRLANYLFKVRSNPKSGFWPTHKASVRSVCAMGDGFYFVEEQFGSAKVPWSYEFVPLGECYVSVDMKGRILRFYRLRSLTAEQIAQRWGERTPAKIKAMADDPNRRQTKVDVAHAVIPRDPVKAGQGFGVFAAPWHGVYFLPEEKVMLQETGYWEMPYQQHSWNRMAGRAFSEGPMALALAEVKSLNEMSKNELISSQQAVRPPLAAYGENFGTINLNAGKVNRGLVTGDGKLLVQPIMTHTRPDFAQAVIETRRNSVREMLYLNLWQILIERPDMTATEALLRAQEKGDLLGPVGISFNHSLATMLERELGILGRKGAFEPGSPLEAPESIVDKDIMPNFTSPLDRMRNMEEVLGAQRTVQGMLEVAAFDPAIMKRLNTDRYTELLRRGNGAPADLLHDEDTVQQEQNKEAELQQLAQTIELVRQGGEAAGALGSGSAAMQAAMQGGAAPAPAVAQAVAA